jgi:hypothetical protein
MTGQSNYLEAAVKIANTLAKHTIKGDSIHSPLPFKVNTETGETGTFTASLEDKTITGISCYTTNWAPTMSLFLSLHELNTGKTDEYQTAFQLLLDWTKTYPLRNNRWGPFFEDVSGWSDTQINAMTMARFIMEHQAYFPNWKKDVKIIIDWVYSTLGNKQWEKYGVIAINEQTSFPVPGNSHTARQGADELFYARLTGDMSNYVRAMMQLIWATYMVDSDGKNRFPTIEIWLTDGYGDYIRHYLRAMADFPELAPPGTDHILSSTSVIQQADYQGRHHKELKIDSGGLQTRISYETFDNQGTEQIRLIKKPTNILLNGNQLTESDSGEGYVWQQLQKGGILTINRLYGNQINILY